MHHNPVFIKNLSYRYPDGNLALDRVNISIKAGEKVALIGANGSGKSTLQFHLNGIFLPQAGEIMIGEWAINNENLAHIRNFVGLVFQNPDNQLFMPTVWEDVAFGPMNKGIKGHELKLTVIEAMEAVNINPDIYASRNPDNLSGGEKKRVAIAGVLAMNPQVLVLDEPSAQLDPHSRRQLINLLHKLPLTLLVATHDLDLAWELCERTIILSKGQVVYDGKTDRIMSNHGFLEQHALEAPLSFSRPYCNLQDRPNLAFPNNNQLSMVND
ncbi:energy-coupling factor ABC transporter ATP-binding protein [Crocosphaera sp. Alani8]|uniref:energy-coupling factor ABC transporter ATP-binding protein n=1 Tax=Crocosphaera sp. Alani8 TaxID=3038952 RepID=UPI00313AA4EA